MFSASRGAPKWAPYGPQIAFRASLGIKIYGNLVREGPESAPRQKKSSKRRSQERKKVVQEGSRNLLAKNKTRFSPIWRKIGRGRRDVAGR